MKHEALLEDLRVASSILFTNENKKIYKCTSIRIFILGHKITPQSLFCGNSYIYFIKSAI